MRKAAVCNIWTLLSVCFLLSFGAVSAHANLADGETLDVVMLDIVYSKIQGDREQVFFSEYTKGQWTPPVQISDSKKPAFHPVTATGDDGKKWAVWSQFEEKGVQMYYALLNGGGWSEPAIIQTGLKDNRFPALIVGDNNRPLLAWSGSDGNGYADIYFTEWDGRKWGTPQKVNKENDVPDIEPRFSKSSEGTIELSWTTFRDGSYVSVHAPMGDMQSGLRIAPVAKGEGRVERLADVIAIPALPVDILHTRGVYGNMFLKTEEGESFRPVRKIIE